MIGIGFGVGDKGIRARAESAAGFEVAPVIRVLEFVAPMVSPACKIALFVEAIFRERCEMYECPTRKRSLSWPQLIVAETGAIVNPPICLALWYYVMRPSHLRFSRLFGKYRKILRKSGSLYLFHPTYSTRMAVWLRH
jgi:hypothetical protein